MVYFGKQGDVIKESMDYALKRCFSLLPKVTR